MDSQLREAALQGTAFSDPTRNRVLFGVRLGASPIASLALQGARLPDSVLQSIGNLVAIGLERARAEELGHEVEAAKRSEQLRTTLLDAMAHEFKTPLTAIRAATTGLLGSADLNTEKARRMLNIADEEATHLEELIDNALDTAKLESAHIQIDLELGNLNDAVREVLSSMKNEIGDRPVVYEPAKQLPPAPMDRRLLKLAVKQLLDNALKYSPLGATVKLQTLSVDGNVALDVTDHGKGIPQSEQARIFERFYRSASVQDQIPGAGLGLSIAHRILEAHKGNLTVTSHPGETTFRLVLPIQSAEVQH
jgi:two-component system sensor histidine kinase KdpD